MSKVQDLNDAIKAINTNDYNDAIIALGPKPVSFIAEQTEYKPKRKVVDDEIRQAKKQVGLVHGSINSLDKKLEDAQTSIDYAKKKLDTQKVSSDAIFKVKSDINKAQKNISIIRFNLAVLKKKLTDLGYTI